MKLVESKSKRKAAYKLVETIGSTVEVHKKNSKYIEWLGIFNVVPKWKFVIIANGIVEAQSLIKRMSATDEIKKKIRYFVNA